MYKCEQKIHEKCNNLANITYYIFNIDLESYQVLKPVLPQTQKQVGLRVPWSMCYGRHGWQNSYPEKPVELARLKSKEKLYSID